MNDIYNKMSESEQDIYKNLISKFIEHVKGFSGIIKENEEVAREDVQKYINLMEKYIPDLKIDESLKEQGIRFFILQELDRVYKNR